jgi:hypothetical protein
MKKSKALIFTLGMMLFCSFATTAQDKLKTKLTADKKNPKVLAYTITSTNEFYVGNNKHILRIGNKEFDLYEQNNIDGKGKITFFIPKADYDLLKEGTRAYLTYGEIGDNENDTEIEKLCKQNLSPCWSLGRFSKKLSK